MASLRKSITAASIVVSMFVAFPAAAYHENTNRYNPYQPTYTNTYNSPYSDTYYLPSSTIDDIVTALREENRAYKQYDEMHRRFGSAEFGHVALAKKSHTAELTNLLRRYGVNSPLPTGVQTQSVYTLEDACRLASQNEERVSKLYSNILIRKVQGYPEVKVLFQKFQRAAHNDFMKRFKACTSYSSYQVPYYQPTYVPTTYVRPNVVPSYIQGYTPTYKSRTSRVRRSTRRSPRVQPRSYSNYRASTSSNIRWYPSNYSHNRIY